jgi:hypothetical protein
MIIEHSNENLRTSLNAILRMPERDRLAFYATPEGQEIVKGLILEDETAKKIETPDGRTWDEDEIQRTIVELNECSVDEFKYRIASIPYPILSIMGTNLKHSDQILKAHNGMDLIKGAARGTPGYAIWLEKKRARQVAKTPIDSKNKGPVKKNKGQVVKPKKNYKEFLKKK